MLTQSILHLLTNSIFPVISAIVAAFVVILLRKLSSKLHFQNLGVFSELITKAANEGVALAEEAGAASLKHLNIKMTGEGKLSVAAAHIIALIPSVSKSTAERFANIAVAKIAGLGATGDKVVK